MCRKTLLGCLAVAVVFFVAREAAAQQPKERQRGAVEDTAAYLVKAHDSIALTRSRMQDLQTQIERVRAQLDASKISPEAKEKIRGALNKSEPLVRTGLGHLQTWEDATGKVKHGMDLYGEMKGMVSIAQGLDPKAGDLGTHLKALSDLLDTYGGEVPLIGPFLQAYGQVTNAMLGSLDRLSQNFDEVVRQGHVGGETSTLVPHRNKVLFNQKPDGETVFREFLYAPCGPSYAYKPVGTEPNTASRVLLWDESADYWYVIKHPVRVERVYADHLLIDIDLNPAQMARQLRQDIYKKSQERRDRAEPLFKYLNDNMAAIALCTSADTTGIAIHKLDLFRARFAYVPEYPAKVQTMMRQLFDCACKSGHADSAEKIRSVALAAGLEEANQWKCQFQGPWTVKLFDTFGGFDPTVYFDAEAVIQSNGQVDITAKVNKVVKHNQSPVVMRTKSVDVRYVFKEVRKQPDGTFLLVHGFTRTVVHERESFITNGFTTQPPEISTPNWNQAKIDPSVGLSGIAKFFAGSEGKASWSAARPDDPPATVSGFAGLWDVYMYPSATNPPAQPSRVKITIEGNEAVAFEEIGTMSNVAYRGPLSDGGSVWNAAKKVGTVIVMKVENARLSPDGNRFEGTWSGAAPHGYPIKGVRAGTGGPTPVAPVVPTPSEPTPPVLPPTQQAADVQLSNASPHERVNLAPGAILKVHVKLAGGTGYSLQAVSPPAGAATMMRGPAIEYPTTGKLGAPTIYHYEYRVGASPPREFQIAYRLMRGSASGGQYDVAVTVVGSTAPETNPPATPLIEPPIVKPPVVKPPVVAPPVAPPKDAAVGAEKLHVPDWVGKTFEVAATEARKLGLKLQYKSETGEGMFGPLPQIVVRQAPTAGEQISAGSTVLVIIRGDLINVPQILGYRHDVVKQKLDALKLVLAADGDTTGGVALRAAPHSGEMVPPGTAIRVTFGTSSALIALPSVIGMNEPDARAKLVKAGFQDQNIKVTGDPHAGPIGTQAPDAGKMCDPKQIVWLEIQTKLVRVPDVVGTPKTLALNVLEKARLHAVVNGDPSLGPVENQQPKAGAYVALNSNVQVYFPHKPGATVPGVVGLTESQARAKLEQFKLSMKTVGFAQEGVAISQAPPAGTMVETGSTVTVSFPLSQSAVVPVVIGLRYEQVIATLQAANLKVQMEGNPQQGSATSQRPAAGTKVPPGSTVAVTFPSVPPPVVVPNVVGLTSTAARGEIESRGLIFRIAGGDAGGRVASQIPPAGSVTAKGSNVMITFAALQPPQPAMVTVPNVLGVDYATATRLVQAAGLTARPTGDVQNGRVRSQTPTPGSQAPRGTPVQLQFVRGTIR